MKPFDLTTRYLLTAAAYVPGKPLRAKRDGEPSLADLDQPQALTFAAIVGTLFGAIGVLGFVAATKIEDPKVVLMLAGEHPLINAAVGALFLTGFSLAMLAWASARGTATRPRARRQR